MIAIKFSPKFEDRVSIFLKNANLKDTGVTYNFKDNPDGEFEYLCYWLFEYPTSKHVNNLLITLKDMKDIMGVDDLEFQYIHSEKEFFTQVSSFCRSIPWFKV